MYRYHGALAVLFGLLTAGGGTLPAQTPTDSARTDTLVTPPSGAPVVVQFDTLFYLHSRLGPFSPEQRAATVSQKIVQHQKGIASGVDSLIIVEVEGHSEVLARDEVLMTVLDSDAKPTGRPRAELAQLYVDRIREVAAAATRETGLKALVLDSLYVLLTTAALLLVLRLLKFVFTRVYASASGPRVPALRVQKLEVMTAQRLREVITVIARTFRVVLTITLLYFYVPLVLSFFPWTAPYSPRIVGYVLSPLGAVLAGFMAYLPKIFFILVIVLVTRYILKLILLVFKSVQSGSLTFKGFHPDWAMPTYNIVRFLVIAFAAVVMFPYLPGAGSDAFKGVSLFVGVLFSLGSSGAVGNIVAGVVLTYTRAFQIGDRVKIGDTSGDVIERTLLVTRIRTIKNVDVTIPNGAVLGNQVINYTSQAKSTGIILHTTVTIGYDAPWKQVHEFLIAAARATPGILERPDPFVLQTSLDDFYVSYEINAYTDNPSSMAGTYSSLHQNIQDRFNEGGVEILSPHYRAQRDGNQIGIPASYLARDYTAPSFRVARTGE